MNENKKIQNRLDYIDLFECIAMFFIVLYHNTIYSYDFITDNRPLYYGRYLFRCILASGVPMFFFANGYLLFNRPFDLKKHILKMVRLIIITFIWGLIYIACIMMIKNEYLSVKEIISTLWTWKIGWTNTLWYMGALICIYVFFPMLKQVYDTNKKIFIYFTVICAILSFGNRLMNEGITVGLTVLKYKKFIESFNFFTIFNPFREIFGYSFVYFCVGGLMYSKIEQIKEQLSKRRNAISLLGIAGSCLGLWILGIIYSKASGTVWDVVWNGYDTIFTFINVILIFTLCLNCKRGNKFIRSVSQNTLGIYFIHFILVNLLKRFTGQIEFLRNIPANIILSVLILCISLMISMIIRKIPLLKKLL